MPLPGDVALPPSGHAIAPPSLVRPSPSGDPSGPGFLPAYPAGLDAVPDPAKKASIGQMAMFGSASSPLPDLPAAPVQASAPRQAPAAAPAHPAREVIDLLWFNPASMLRIRKHPAWKDLLADVKPRPDDEDLDDDAPQGKRPSAKDRRDILAILARGKPLTVDALDQVIADAIGDDGAFTPPLALVAGELELLFDEVETLKALVAAVSPLAVRDKRLKDAVDAIHEAFKMPWVQGATSVVEGMTAQLKDALAQSAKEVNLRTIDAHVERALLENRLFQKRMVMSQTRIRTLLHAPGGGARVAAFVPESVGKELPACVRFGARVMAELRLSPDHRDKAMLRVIAVSGVIRNWRSGWR
ncbi:Hypothetical protein CAP_8654 [Chondromyces apiculatus DSM 436]|uniref:Uncharacterized protein n=1 Tax=Chondromyces apiculatus DSM 436 TaxID=1192034 RepID=A0A017SXT9_9BACT|nr:Hypothetical protein CAP_8654 [Chondromyces apiculatus DSM 436]